MNQGVPGLLVRVVKPGQWLLNCSGSSEGCFGDMLALEWFRAPRKSSTTAVRLEPTNRGVWPPTVTISPMLGGGRSYHPNSMPCLDSLHVKYNDGYLLMSATSQIQWRSPHIHLQTRTRQITDAHLLLKGCREITGCQSRPRDGQSAVCSKAPWLSANFL